MENDKSIIDINIKIQDEIDSGISLDKKLKIISISVLLGIIFRYFYNGDSIGISELIFASLFIIACIYSVKDKVNLKSRFSNFILLFIFIMCLNFCIYNNNLIRLFNFILVPIAISAYIITIRYENVDFMRISSVRYIMNRLLNSSFSNMKKIFSFSKQAVKNDKTKVNNDNIKSVLIGIVVSIPLLIIVISLLASADMMFDYYIRNLKDAYEFIIERVNLADITGDIIVVLFFSMYFFGYIWSLKYECEEYKIKDDYKWINPVTILTVLCLLCGIYLLFSIVQSSYLYGGNKHVLPSGYSYSRYARHGFFELLTVALINFSILIFNMKNVKITSDKINKTLNVFYTILLVFTGNMLFSSNYKLTIYERALGFTRLRIYVHIFLFTLSIVLIYGLIKIWKKNFNVFKFSLISIMIIYMVVNCVNIDKIIVNKNIKRYNETGRLDKKYIRNLSYDAIDAIKQNEYKLDTKLVEEYIKEEKEYLQESYDHWYEYNYYKSKFLHTNI
ncbi:DUF4153 domain-containing protein [Tepidibacter hydrothermalis]|uniref:DUF4173 domain-containing protein n=1 Tax=Tepidibacter hydrothermalis TaxID=3036126 RepID=A0ABY8ECZ7_9FIRM|nr:DUF4173 domain-containing protein [Tepidibacter hydrothermalis]WFD10806.1 DUF4173 domain-containing protein [Tepidibacter hydrothermalis]